MQILSVAAITAVCGRWWLVRGFAVLTGALLLLGTSGCLVLESLQNLTHDDLKDMKLVDPPKTLEQKKADYEKWIADDEYQVAQCKQEIAKCDAEINAPLVSEGRYHEGEASKDEPRNRRQKIANNMHDLERRLKDLRGALADVNQSLAEAREASKNAAKEAVKPIVRPPVIKPGC